MNSLLIKRAGIALLGIALAASAHALTISDALGRVVNGVAADAVTDAMMINSLVARANGTSPAAYDIVGKTYTLLNDPIPVLPLAVWASTSAVGGDNTVDIGLGGYAYLSVKYNGANGSELVFYIQGLSGGLPVPATDLGFGANQYSLFNVAGAPPGVPDGGATIVLLGVTLGIVGLARRKFRG